MNSPIICQKLNTFVFGICKYLSYLNLVLIATIFIQVVLRYVFNYNMVILEEMQWHLYAIIIMFGLSYAMAHHSHVRVDVLSHQLPSKFVKMIEIVGILILMIPFLIIVIDHGSRFTYEAFRVGESSDAPGGLPFRFLIKAVMPLSFIILSLQTFSKLIENIYQLIKQAN